MDERGRSDGWLARARKSLPGGVSSPVRAFDGVGCTPPVIRSARGARMTDVDGREYLDFVGSSGSLILGSAHPKILAAIEASARCGTSFGASSPPEIELAEHIGAAYPGIEQVRFVSSGTEAVTSAVRLARGATGRELIVKFTGCYHGAIDYLLVSALSSRATFGNPWSAGVPASYTAATRVLPLDDDERAEALFVVENERIAAVLIEPVPTNNGLLVQRREFLAKLRELCNRYGALLIFDEVTSGFRLGAGGAAEHYGVTPDLATFGNVIGGGLPVGALAGRRDLMRHLAPEGDVYQAGTLSGNPVAMAAGLKTLELIAQPGFFAKLGAKTLQLTSGLQHFAKKHRIALSVQQVGGMFGLFFSEKENIETFADVSACDLPRFKKFFHGMLEQGVYLAPSAYEAGFVSAAHSETDIADTLAAAEHVFKIL